MYKFMISSYCSLYGPKDVYLVENVDDIVKYIINYIIYDCCIYKSKDFEINNIPTIDSITKIIENDVENELENNYVIRDWQSNFTFGPKEILVYKASAPNNSEYYVTIKIMKDIESLDFEDFDYLKNITNYFD
jgi:hypothetical protein